MNKSEPIAALAAALSEFQGECANAFKGKDGHGYKYADLASIIDLTKSALKAHGLSVVQMPCNAADGFVGMETMLMHSSGEWLSQSFEMAVPENKRNSQAQNIGSAVSYARRYSLAACLGIAQTDSDASIHSVEDDTPTQTDLDWVAAAKKDAAALDQITDPAYRKKIEGLMK